MVADEARTISWFACRLSPPADTAPVTIETGRAAFLRQLVGRVSTTDCGADDCRRRGGNSRLAAGGVAGAKRFGAFRRRGWGEKVRCVPPARVKMARNGARAAYALSCQIGVAPLPDQIVNEHLKDASMLAITSYTQR